MWLHVISTRGTTVFVGSLTTIERVNINSSNANHSDLVIDENQNARNSIIATIKISRDDLIKAIETAYPSPGLIVKVQETS